MQIVKGKAYDTPHKLKQQHANESEDSIQARFAELIKNDEALREDMLRAALKMMADEKYDKAARERREIPEALRRPS
jgi:formiminotetrahydrofolate cyclodeaminase